MLERLWVVGLMIGIGLIDLVLAASFESISFCLNRVSQLAASSTFTVRNKLRTLKPVLAIACTVLQVFGTGVVDFVFEWIEKIALRLIKFKGC